MRERLETMHRSLPGVLPHVQLKPLRLSCPETAILPIRHLIPVQAIPLGHGAAAGHRVFPDSVTSGFGCVMSGLPAGSNPCNTMTLSIVSGRLLELLDFFPHENGSAFFPIDVTFIGSRRD
jgi:hypothetical protein